MNLALKEIRHSKLRYALITGMIVLVSSLVFILSGLANGLAKSNSEAIDAMPADTFLIAEGSQNRFDRSSISPESVKAAQDAAGADKAVPFGSANTNLKREGASEILGSVLLALPPGSAIDPTESKIAEKGSIIADESMLDEGVKVGDELTVEPGGVKLKVIDSVKNRQFQLIATGYISMETWDQIRESQGNTSKTVSGIALVDVDDNTVADVDGTDVAKRGDIIQNLPGYSAQANTFLMIQAFLITIASGIIAAFFFIITLQKMPELGVMKALGMKTRELAVSLFLQILILGIIGGLIGIAIADTVALVVGQSVPFRLEWQDMIRYGLILLVVAIVGGMLSLYRIARVDPLDAINNAA